MFQVHLLALFHPKMSIIIQKRHPYTGNINSELAGDSKILEFLHCRGVLPISHCQIWFQFSINEISLIVRLSSLAAEQPLSTAQSRVSCFRPGCSALHRTHRICHAFFISWHTLDCMKFQCIEHVKFQLLM